jgi:hypothetical protein
VSNSVKNEGYMKKILFFILSIFAFGSGLAMQPEVKQEAEAVLEEDSGEFITKTIIEHPQSRAFLSYALLSIDQKFPEAIDELISQYLSPLATRYFIEIDSQVRDQIAGKEIVDSVITCFKPNNKACILVCFTTCKKNLLTEIVPWNITEKPKIWVKINKDNQELTNGMRKVLAMQTDDKVLTAHLYDEGLFLDIDLKVLHEQYLKFLAALKKKNNQKQSSACLVM